MVSIGIKSSRRILDGQDGRRRGGRGREISILKRRELKRWSHRWRRHILALGKKREGLKEDLFLRGTPSSAGGKGKNIQRGVQVEKEFLDFPQGEIFLNNGGGGEGEKLRKGTQGRNGKYQT